VHQLVEGKACVGVDLPECRRGPRSGHRTCRWSRTLAGSRR
jgi:hypothetical protein